MLPRQAGTKAPEYFPPCSRERRSETAPIIHEAMMRPRDGRALRLEDGADHGESRRVSPSVPVAR
jgi:hypothetical protein